MFEVAIFGAGDLGGSICDRLARRDSVSTIRLIDEARSIAAGKALDIRQSAPLEGFATTVVDDAGVSDGGRVDCLVIADAPVRGEWRDEEGLALVKRLVEQHPHTPIICPGAGQRALIELAVRDLHLDRSRLVGTAPEALAAAIRSLVAIEINGSAIDVALAVLGIPPDHAVVPWEDASIGGLAISRLLSQTAQRRLAERAGVLWPPGAQALAAAAVQAIDCMVGQSRRRISAFVGPDDSAGVRTRAAALPVRLDRRGIVHVEMPTLNTHDRIAFENAVML